MNSDDEEKLLQKVSLQNAQSLLHAPRSLHVDGASRDRAPEEGRAAHDGLRDVFFSMRDAVVATGRDGVITFLNRAAEALLGLSFDKARGARLEDVCEFLDERTRAPAAALAIGAYEGGGSVRTVDLALLVGRDGTEVVVERHSAPIQNERGTVTGVVLTLHDVTHRREYERTLREKEDLFRRTFQQAAVGLAITAVDGTFLDVNEKFCDVLGRTVEDLRGKSIASVTHRDDVPMTEERIAALVRGEMPYYTVEKRYLRADKVPVWSHSTVSVLRDADGKPKRLILVVEDISTRRAMEEALLEETRMLEILNETAPALSANLDLEALVQGITDAATALSGAKSGAFFYHDARAETAGMNLYAVSGTTRSVFDDARALRPAAPFGPTFRSDAAIRIDDATKDPRYGTIVPAFALPKGHPPVKSYLAVPVVSRSGEVVGGLVFIHPEASVFSARSERLLGGLAAQAAVGIDNARLYEHVKRAADERERLLQAEGAARTEAERASLMKDEFLATISHELRTPLNAILGWSQILLTGGGKGGVTRGIEVIARNARAQAKLIEDLLDMSRIICGKVHLEMQPIDVRAIVEAAIESARPSADAKSIRIRSSISLVDCVLAGDPNRLQQVIWNLLTNAVKFTSRGGTIDVVVSERRAAVEIAVVDTGRGIEPAFLPLVFDRFRQADASTTRAHGGLGLGLSIVKHLVELHGGKVEARSAGEGRGSTFIVSLPMAARSDRPVDELSARDSVRQLAAAVSALNDLQGIRILAIDDEVDARELLQEVLEQFKADVSVAGSVSEGLEVLEAKRPDVVISDVGMPERDGYDFLRQLRTLPASRGGTIPAIALTAFARNEDRVRAIAAGFQVHLTKPVEPRELVAAIRTLTGRAQGA